MKVFAVWTTEQVIRVLWLYAVQEGKADFSAISATAPKPDEAINDTDEHRAQVILLLDQFIVLAKCWKSTQQKRPHILLRSLRSKRASRIGE